MAEASADLVVYSDDDPSKVATLMPVGREEAQRYPADAVFGADALAMHVTSLIDGVPVDLSWWE